jgi:membrane associated rhomboid family serine protease
VATRPARPHTAAVSQKLGQGHGDRSALVTEAKAQALILGGFAGLLWLIQILNAFVFGGALVGLGVVPRTLAGLWGVLFAPFIHGSFTHLIANTVPLVVLGWLVMLRRKRDLFTVSLISALVGGLGTWLIAPALSVTVGASVLVFGYLGYLLSRGIFERRFWPIAGSLLVFFLYGGALFGVLPGAIGISWQAHLFGLLGGVLAARMMRGGTGAVVEPQRPVRRRIAEGAGAGARVAAVADQDAEIEAELERAREMVRARGGR